ncbi:hypothetical protein PZ897_03580 [Hoeflea sp. YIM 152468]|uniref:hypothetical protein n=1 Tax=Hoeflea sp. YIM 152468 TaxID=3031759 RepID=UPI0023D9DD06|nr:hypothetical protein [Hoeflea sp. YIM 152468]MDF1607252.1 hypothetical protein [Hoeflea sp. YIM 152468]
MRNLGFFTILVSAVSLLNAGASHAQQIDPPRVMQEAGALSTSESDIEFMKMTEAVEPGRQTFFAPKSSRGSTIPVPTAVVEKLCGDGDGCQVRIGMYDWDGTGRTASREFLFYYNNTLRNWRASLGDTWGQDADNVVQHVNNSWACYFTDGEYANWAGVDTQVVFGLLSWNQYNASCVLTLID